MSGREKVTVALSVEGNEALERLLETPWFDKGLDAFRVAVAAAVAEGLRSDRDKMGRMTTKYNVGSVDPSGKMAALLRAFYPAEVEGGLFELAEELGDAGLSYLDEGLAEGKTLAELLAGEATKAS